LLAGPRAQRASPPTTDCRRAAEASAAPLPVAASRQRATPPIHAIGKVSQVTPLECAFAGSIRLIKNRACQFACNGFVMWLVMLTEFDLQLCNWYNFSAFYSPKITPRAFSIFSRSDSSRCPRTFVILRLSITRICSQRATES